MTKIGTYLNWQSQVLRMVWLVIGALIGAISVIVFMAPFNLAPGGVTGAAIILNELFNWPIGLMIIVGNIPIMLLAYRMIGLWAVLSAGFVVVIYSLAIDLLTPFFPAQGLSDNVLLNALFAGVLGGISGGIIFRSGGTGGGTATLARIIQLKFGTPMSTTYLYTDMLVVGAAGVFFGWEASLYAAVALFVNGLATDYVLEGPSVIRTAVIITDQPQAVADGIMGIIGRGVTSWQAQGMYTGHNHTVLYVTIGRSQVSDLRGLVQSIDPNAFIVIGQGHAAYGAGFGRPKVG